jgi:hypothetical protein
MKIGRLYLSSGLAPPMQVYGANAVNGEEPESAQVRGPVETGALPGQSLKADNGGWLNMDVSQQNSSPQYWGRPNIQSGS